jgi:hypothetical protein
MIHLNPLDRLRLQRNVEHPHALDPRATTELLAEVGHRNGGMPCILGLLGEYQQRLSPQMPRAVGSHRFPSRPLRVVPR